MNHIIKILFQDNPLLAEEVYHFCQGIPDYLQAEQQYHALADEVEKRIGIQKFLLFEDAMNYYHAMENKVYYLFGLGLRQEVLSAMQGDL